MTEPLTDEQHTAIRQRHARATGGTWYLQPNHGRDFVATEQAGYERGIGDLDFGVGDQADADREFVLNAHTDMTALFAEVARLRAERDQARAAGMREAAAMLRRYCPDHGGLDEAFIGCHCPAADEIERDANALPSAQADQLDADEWVRCSHPHCPNGERHAKAAERGWQAAHMGTWLCPTHRTTTPCTCGRIALGTQVTEHREWNPNCQEHGTDSTWWNSPEQQAARDTRRAESLKLQARAKQARLAARAGAPDAPSQAV